MNKVYEALVKYYETTGSVMDEMEFKNRFQNNDQKEILIGILDFDIYLDGKRIVG